LSNFTDKAEVAGIASFIGSLSPDIPYALLEFSPHHRMNNLPPTFRRHAKECLAEAKTQGLRNVKLGDIHLLADYYQEHTR